MTVHIVEIVVIELVMFKYKYLFVVCIKFNLVNLETMDHLCQLITILVYFMSKIGWACELLHLILPYIPLD